MNSWLTQQQRCPLKALKVHLVKLESHLHAHRISKHQWYTVSRYYSYKHYLGKWNKEVTRLKKSIISYHLWCKIASSPSSSIKEEWEIRGIIMWDIGWFKWCKISKVKPVPRSNQNILTFNITYRSNLIFLLHQCENNKSYDVNKCTHHDKLHSRDSVSLHKATTEQETLERWVIFSGVVKELINVMVDGDKGKTWKANHFFSTRLRKGRVLSRSWRLLKKYCLNK